MILEYLNGLGITWKDQRQLSVIVASSLARIPRFCGHTPIFYSVAEHCVLCSHTCEEAPLAALIHDVGEVVTGDIPTPAKNRLGRARVDALEAEIVEEFIEAMGIRTRKPDVHCTAVRQADLALLAAEKAQLFPTCPHWPQLDAVIPANVRIEHWDQQKAAGQWLTRFNELRKVITG